VSGSYRDLKVWQKSIDLVAEIYVCTRSFPKDEQYGLVSQLRRGCGLGCQQHCGRQGKVRGQGTRTIFAPSPGSLCEIETQLTIADRLGLLSSENASRLSEAAGEIARMLNGLINALKRSMAA